MPRVKLGVSFENAGEQQLKNIAANPGLSRALLARRPAALHPAARRLEQFSVQLNHGLVMRGLVPRIHARKKHRIAGTSPGTSPAMTMERWFDTTGTCSS
jgi:hypothetical protein